MRNFQKFYISVLIILCLFLNNACSKAPEADSPFLSSFNQQEQQYYMVDIRGEVNRPGIYKVESGAMINDQTTPNMIQRISGIFERNPLISKEI